MNVSVLGRIIQICWSLTGLVLNGIIIGSIISALIVATQAVNIELYNTKVIFLYKMILIRTSRINSGGESAG